MDYQSIRNYGESPVDDPDQPELNQIMADVQAAVDDARAEDDDGDGDSYEREITIAFPPQVTEIHNVSDITVSIRDLLTWAAAAHEENPDVLIAIRDDYYGGDDEGDYAYEVDNHFGFFSPEQNARARAARLKHRFKRDVRRAKLEAEYRVDEAKEFAKWMPFLEEKIALEAEREANWKRAEALDAEWDVFVARWPSPDPSNREETAERAGLEAKGEALGKDQDAWDEKWSELKARIDLHPRHA